MKCYGVLLGIRVSDVPKHCSVFMFVVKHSLKMKALRDFETTENMVFSNTAQHLKGSDLTLSFTHSLTHSLTPWSTVLLEKLTVPQPIKKFPAFYGTPRFITAFTSACQLSLSWASSIQPIPPHPTSWRSTLIFSSHLRLGLPIGLFPSGFPHQNPVYTSLLPHTRYMSRPSNSSRFYHIGDKTLKISKLAIVWQKNPLSADFYRMFCQTYTDIPSTASQY